MKRLFTAIVLLVLCLSARASAQVSTTTLILEDDATLLPNLNTITISAPPDNLLTSNYAICFPNHDGLAAGSLWYVSALSPSSSLGPNSYRTEWLTVGNEGDVLTVVGGLPKWQVLPPTSLSLTKNALWLGDANNHAAELAAGAVGSILQIDASGTPNWQAINLLPTGTTPNSTLVWNGTQWIENTQVGMNPVSGDITTSGDVNSVDVNASGNATIGENLTVNGTQVNLPNGSIDNSELANSSVNVAYGAGLSGDASVALGGTLNLQNTGVTGATAGAGINVSGPTGNVTITNTGVTSLAGTANQVSVSAPNGAVMLSLPQDIDANATPTFDGVTLDNLTAGSASTNVVVSNGGSLETRTVNSLVGASNLTENNIWVGNAANNPAELAAGTNGQILQINGSGAPTWQSINLMPTGTTPNTTLVWNGTQWVENTNVTMNPSNGNTTIGGNLTVNGTQVTLPGGSVDNSELANSSVNVAYGTGLSGDASVALGGTLNVQNTGVTGATAGTGINVSGPTGNVTITNTGVTGATAGTGINVSGPTGNVTITNTGVTSLAGTANQVSVSAPNGAVMLSLPQDIDANATPTFDGVTLDNLTAGSASTNVVVSNGGSLETRTVNSLVGASNLTQNRIWVGNATNNPAELAAGTNGQILQINGSGAPTWQSINLMPTGTTPNTTLVWNGTQWVENTNVTMNATSGDITTNGDVNAVDVTTSGNTTVGGNLTVNGTQVNLPNGSIDNSELANSSVNVAYGTGLSGDASVALGGTLNVQNTGVTGATAGTGINVSGPTGNVTITNTGVTSLTGTANQVTASASTGGVTLSLPQNIHAAATPTFGNLTLTAIPGSSTAANVVVSNAGTLQTRTINSLVGASTLTQNRMWVGNASNNPAELAPGTNGQVLTVVGGAPTWQSLPNALPNGTTTNATLIWNGTQWVENTNVTMHPVTGDILTNGSISAGGNSTVGGNQSVGGNTTVGGNASVTGNATIGGNLTVTAGPVNLPNGTIDNNELANSSVNVSYGTGLSGSSSVALGGTLNLQNTGVTGVAAGSGINVSGSTGNVTITNSGVTSLTGTTNQVNVSAPNGAVTLSLPQSIHTGATPTFNRMTLTNMQNSSSATEIVVSNGGVLETRSISSLPSGSTSLNYNSIWVGNASNQAAQLGSTGVNGAVLQLNSSGSPSWSNDLNVHNVQISSQLTVNGNQVNSGDVTFNGNNFIISGTTNSVFNGPLTVNGATTLATTLTTNGHATLNSGLTVNGGPVNFPNNSINPSALTSSSINVSYGAGLSGSSSVALGGTLNLQNTGVTGVTAGTGINLSGSTGNVTITNSGVTSLTGTGNQVNVSSSTGGVTLSLPQSIHTGATPTFGNLTLTSMPGGSSSTNIVVSNGGVLETRTLASLSSGVTSITGTANQVIASASTGAVTLSLPQSIHTAATPTFGNLTLTAIPGSSTAANVVVSNAGTLQTRTINSLVGASTLTQNRMWVGNASNNPAELAPGTNGQVLTVVGGAPAWQTVNTLPAGTVSNSTLRWNGTAWVENTTVTSDATGNVTVGGNLTVSGTQANLPNGSVSNAELANSSVNVTYGTGVSGSASVALGGTLSLQNTGVTSLTGTANQVTASASTGAVTLSLPQNIHTAATPTFGNLTLTAMPGSSTATNVVVSNGGVLETRTIASLTSTSGVTSITGTANQVIASASTGAVTLSLPQSIHTAATPTFGNLTLTAIPGSSTAANVVVSNAGTLQTRTINSLVGASTLTQNRMWVGNASNNPAELAPGTNGQVLTVVGGAPAWQTVNTLPAGTVSNSTLRWNGTAWVENTTVTSDATGNVTVGGNLTVSGTQANLPNGSVSNAELANSSVNVTYGTGVSGSASVALGGTLSLQNTGVTSLTGTANQVTASASTGAVTLSLPQNIHTAATPTFGNLTLTAMPGSSTATNVVVSNGGVLETRTIASLGSSSGWSLTGNSSTTDGTNFLGTTDNVAFNVKVNNQRGLRIEPNTTYAPDLIGGYSGNTVNGTGSEGNVIAGGGASSEVNLMNSNVDYSNIGGGAGNEIGASVAYGVIAGGYFNEIDVEADNAFVGGGQGNITYDRHDVVVGGFQNKAGSDDANYTNAAYASVVGGYQNQATAYKSFIGGGLQNYVSGERASVVGGNNNEATASEAFVGGGRQNEAQGEASAVLGGVENNATGSYTSVLGGRGLTLSGSRSVGFLAGNTGSNDMTISTSDIAAIGNANLWMVNNNNTPSQVRFYEANATTGTYPAGANYSSFQAQSQSANIQYKLPDTAGVVGDVLAVKAVSGSDVTLDWVSGSGSSSNDVGSLIFARKTADETVSGTTLQNDDHLFLSLQANATYEISGIIYCERDNGSPDMDVAWSVPGGTGTGSSNSTMLISYSAFTRKSSGNRDVGADIRTSSGTSPGDTQGTIDMASNNLVFIEFRGLVMTGSTSGNITLKWAPTTGGSDRIKVYKNSYMTATQVE